MPARLVTLALAAAAVVSLASCGSEAGSGAASGTSGAAPGTTTVGGERQSAPAPTGADSYHALCDKPGDIDKLAFFATAQRAHPAEKTAHLDGTITMAAGGAGGAGGEVRLAGDLDTTDQANPKAHLTGTGAAKVDMIIADKAIYFSDPRAGGKYLKITPDDLARMSGLDLQQLIDPASAVVTMKDAVTKVTCAGREKVGGTDAAHLTVTVDNTRIQAALPRTGTASQTPSLPAATDMHLWFDAENHPVKASSMVGPATQTVTYGKWGAPVSITAPPAGKVTSAPTVPGPKA